MKIAGNPKIFGPIFALICLLFNVVVVFLFLKDALAGRTGPYIGAPSQTYTLCFSLFLNIAFLTLGLRSFRRRKNSFKFLKFIVLFQILGVSGLLLLTPSNYFLLGILLTVFSWIFGSVTLASSNLTIEKVSDLGVYEVTSKESK